MRVVERVIDHQVGSRSTPRHVAWPPLLRELAVQLDHGDIYQRDLPELTAALTELLTAYRRRHH